MNQNLIPAIKEFVSRKDILTEGRFVLIGEKIKILVQEKLSDSPIHTNIRINPETKEIQIKASVLKEWLPETLFFWIVWAIVLDDRLYYSAADEAARLIMINEFGSNFGYRPFLDQYYETMLTNPTNENVKRFESMIKGFEYNPG